MSKSQVMQLDNLVANPMEEFVKRDLEDVKEKRKKFSKADSNLTSSLVKLSELKQTAVSSGKGIEVNK
jgi:hypothetical protein